MCGIAGIVAPGQNGDWLRATARRMAESLKHRGPDGDGVWSDPQAGVALGHRRLSIIDLSPHGRQPMTSPNGRYVISYNGEIYNHGEMRRELAEGGINFRGHGDTEVMLAAIEHWGLEAAVARFIGMFAFALWDRQKREMSLVRDRLGIKPLYWLHDGRRLLFGSELRSLRACDAWRPEIDPDALAAFLRWNYVPTPFSIYRRVRKLAPGHILVYRAGTAPKLKCYWDMRAIARAAVADRDMGPDTEHADRLDALLRDAVGQRLVSDVPVGALLSGGIDSSIVAACMQAASDRPIRTFTIGFDDETFNEAEHAKAVASHLGTDHTELYLDLQTVQEAVTKMPDVYDEPFADSSQLPTYLVSSMTRDHVTVALSGDGGDESFAGYTRYRWADLLWRRMAWLPHPLRTAVAAGIRRSPRRLWRRLPGRINERRMKLANYLAVADPDSLYRRQHTHWDDPGLLAVTGMEARGQVWDGRVADDLPDFVERMQYFDTVSYLPDDVLTKVDRASMAVGLEARVPLLDHRIVEYCWRLPASAKYRNGEAKWLLRQVLARYVPRRLTDRPKSGFAIPTAAWLRGPLFDWAAGLLDPARLKRDGLLRPEPIRAAWDAFLRGDDIWREPLWGICMFQAWHERYA